MMQCRSQGSHRCAPAQAHPRRDDVTVRTITLILAIASIAMATSVADGRAGSFPSVPHYAIELAIDPATQTIAVAGTLAVPADAVHDGRAVFLLHEQLAVDSFIADMPHETDLDAGSAGSRYMPNARKIVVTLAEAIDPGEVLHVEFSYRGAVTRWPGWSANVIGAEWTEIGLYFPWFPYSQDLGLFTYDLSVTCDPSYAVASPGTIRKTAAGWSIAGDAPTNDLVLCLAEDIEAHVAPLGPNELRIYHAGIPAPTLDALATDIVAIDAAFDRWFGPIERDACIVISRREKGGGYGRIGAVFLGGFDGATFASRREGYNRYLAHELAHQWWHGAPTDNWEDWLNESFAEYSALLLIRETFGDERFRARLDEKRQSAAGTSPIRGFDRDADPNTEKILYDKGPVLLNMLEERLGHEQFMEFCGRTLHDGVAATDDLLDLLEATSGEEARSWFANLLVSD